MRYPITRLPKAIDMVIEYELCTRRRLRKPNYLKVESADLFVYYSKGIKNRIAFVIDINLPLKKGPIDPMLDGRLQTIRGDVVANYVIQWGSVNGDLNAGSGLVNSDRTDRPIVPNTVIVKGYLHRLDTTVTGTAFFNPKNAMPIIPEIELTNRERALMFIFAKLSGSEQAMELIRAKTEYDEIAALLQKGAIRSCRGGYTLTLAGESAGSDNPEIDQW